MLPVIQGPNRITSLFRSKERPNHDGVDIVGKLTPMTESDIVYVCATVDMEIIQSRIVTNKTNRTWEWGNYVIGVDELGREHIFAHLRERIAKVGQVLVAGNTIGIMGKTGYSTGIHLHYGVRIQGNYLDPLSILGISNAKVGDIFYNNSVGDDNMSKRYLKLYEPIEGAPSSKRADEGVMYMKTPEGIVGVRGEGDAVWVAEWEDISPTFERGIKELESDSVPNYSIIKVV